MHPPELIDSERVADSLRLGVAGARLRSAAPEAFVRPSASRHLGLAQDRVKPNLYAADASRSPLVRRQGRIDTARGDILDRVTLSYSPLIDRNRDMVATRLTVAPLPNAEQLDVTELCRLSQAVWPGRTHEAWLNITHDERLLRDAVEANWPRSIAIEVPAFFAVDPRNRELLSRRHASGANFILKGASIGEVPPDMLRLFRCSMIDIGDGRGHFEEAENATGNRPDFLQFAVFGIETWSDVEDAFAHGALAVAGWPDEQVSWRTRPAMSTSLSDEEMAVVDLISRFTCGSDIDQIERILRQYPNVLHSMMAFARSAEFGLPLGVASLRSTIQMLGYPRLACCLMLVLGAMRRALGATHRLAAHTAIRRALMLEALGGENPNSRNELLTCGALSAISEAPGMDLTALLGVLPVAEPVHAALVRNTGPYAPLLNLVRAVEGGDRDFVCSRLAAAGVAPGEANLMLLRALRAADRVA